MSCADEGRCQLLVPNILLPAPLGHTAFDQERGLRRLTRLVAITHLSRRNGVLAVAAERKQGRIGGGNRSCLRDARAFQVNATDAPKSDAGCLGRKAPGLRPLVSEQIGA